MDEVESSEAEVMTPRADGSQHGISVPRAFFHGYRVMVLTATVAACKHAIMGPEGTCVEFDSRNAVM